MESNANCQFYEEKKCMKKGICFFGTKRTLYRGKFRATIIKKDRSIFESMHTGRNICISRGEMKEGTSLEISNSQNKFLAKFGIERN